ncbi:hypothetical protein H2248_011303 [Termitomyces sp. 'cryptogamus']|nr:hypothetical protein H2248_011303 [Termitomyces sp. 'cryptogamus']
MPMSFVHGPVYFIWSWDEGQGIVWDSRITNLKQPPSIGNWNAIDRPETYESAVNSARAKITENERQRKLSEDDTLTFCVFPERSFFTWFLCPPKYAKMSFYGKHSCRTPEEF